MQILLLNMIKLKKEDVIGWLEEKLDVAKMKESIKAVIDDKKTQKTSC